MRPFSLLRPGSLFTFHCWVGFLWVHAIQASERPNIVFNLADDLG